MLQSKSCCKLAVGLCMTDTSTGACRMCSFVLGVFLDQLYAQPTCIRCVSNCTLCLSQILACPYCERNASTEVMFCLSRVCTSKCLSCSTATTVIFFVALMPMQQVLFCCVRVKDLFLCLAEMRALPMHVVSVSPLKSWGRSFATFEKMSRKAL